MIRIIPFLLAITVTACSGNTGLTDTVQNDRSDESSTPDTNLDIHLKDGENNTRDTNLETFAFGDETNTDSSNPTDTSDTTGETPEKPFVIALVADCHTLPLGPDESPNDVVGTLLASINNSEPEPTALFALGDNIEDFFMAFEDAEAGEPVPAIESFIDIFSSNLDIPWYVVLGNHDNRFIDTFLGNEVPVSRWLDYFSETNHLPAAWYSVVIKGFNFLVLFGSDGAVDHATNDTNIMLNEQVTWMRRQLDKGMPTILLYHHWLAEPTGESAELHPIHQAVLDYPDVVKATFSGHLHKFMHYTYHGTGFFQVGAAKHAGSDPSAYGWQKDCLLLECDPSDKSVTISNQNLVSWE